METLRKYDDFLSEKKGAKNVIYKLLRLKEMRKKKKKKKK